MYRAVAIHRCTYTLLCSQSIRLAGLFCRVVLDRPVSIHAGAKYRRPWQSHRQSRRRDPDRLREAFGAVLTYRKTLGGGRKSPGLSMKSDHFTLSQILKESCAGRCSSRRHAKAVSGREMQL